MRCLSCREKALFISVLMRVKSRYLIVLSLLFCIFVTPIKADVTFNNGLYNSVDYTIEDNVEIKNSTTVELLTNGRIGGRSIVWDSSELDISGGIVDGYVVSLGNSQIYISSGTIKADLLVNGSSYVKVTGGTIVANDEGNLKLSDTSELLFAGGQVGVNGGTSCSDLGVEGSAFATITGGQIERLTVFDYGQVEIRGGTIGYANWQNAALIHQESSTHVYGGDLIGQIRLGANPYWPDESCQLFVHGTNFKINGLPVEYGTYINPNKPGYTDYYLTGILLSGETINNHIYLYDDSSLVLIPEPATLFLLGLGVVMLRRKC